MKRFNPHADELRQKFLQEASDLIAEHKIDLEGSEVEDLFAFGYHNKKRVLTIEKRNRLNDNLKKEAEYIIKQLRTN